MKIIPGIKCGAVRTHRPFSSFSADEQQQTTAWLDEETFKTKLEISIERDTKKQEISDAEGLARVTNGITVVMNERGSIRSIKYMIKFENRSTVPLADIEVTSRMFYELRMDDKEQKSMKAQAFKIYLKAKESRIVSTDCVEIRDLQQSFPDWGLSDNRLGGKPTVYIKDRLLGMYVCVSKKDWNGHIIKQEFQEGRIPDKNEWAEYR